MMNRLDTMIKHDYFSDLVSSGLGSIGITRDMRDAAQPTINSLLPKGGAVQAPPPPVASIPQSTGYKYNSNFNPVYLAVAALVLSVIYYKSK